MIKYVLSGAAFTINNSDVCIILIELFVTERLVYNSQ